MNDLNNIARIRAVHNALEELADNVVFIGGAAVSLYKDRPASETRVTDDVDIVIELASYGDYGSIEEQLRKKGFANDIMSNIICRYKVNGIVVDVLPTEGGVLGFNNQWYVEGFRNAVYFYLSEREKVKIFNSVYFIASKMDAFNDRGSSDGRTSNDFEDIVYILNNRKTIWEELKNEAGPVKDYLKNEFQKLLNQGYLNEWVSCHLEFSEQSRVNMIIAGLEDFCNKNSGSQ